jgi:hypothetical protein
MTKEKILIYLLISTSIIAMVLTGGSTLIIMLFALANYDDVYFGLIFSIALTSGMMFVISLVGFIIGRKLLKTENETKEDPGPVKIKSRIVQASEYAAKNELSVDTVISMIHNEELKGEKKGNTWYVVSKT